MKQITALLTALGLSISYPVLAKPSPTPPKICEAWNLHCTWIYESVLYQYQWKGTISQIKDDIFIFIDSDKSYIKFSLLHGNNVEKFCEEAAKIEGASSQKVIVKDCFLYFQKK